MDRLEQIIRFTHSTYAKDSDNRGLRPMIAAMGLAEEGAEVLSHYKKAIEQGRNIDQLKLRQELGDVLYYLKLACMDMGITFADLTDTLDEKLKKRYPEGFSAQAAKNRADIE